ncbi:flagellar filament capping protein FliD [Salinicola endophyticus]|uniref:Flagellar hook-associated protein 2 n=1 Tax=Salinicola endophyticus TaxID=1949083 RepID=A0ABY8FPT5_9GAMM|nr:flagellar filament capping protein FliD [Salinicola endophyticus]WFF42776.1 flagellar filament capping protein FliD [Salinicola endophyticus]
MASIASLGIGSGLDLNGLLGDLEKAENKRLEPIAAQQSSYKTKLSAFGKLEGSLNALRDAIGKLGDPSTFTAVGSDITGSAVSVSTSEGAEAGRYKIDVSQLAQAQSSASKDFDSKSDNLGLSGTLSFTVGDGDQIDVDYDDGDSLSDIRDAINDKDAGARASIINDGNGYRLVMTSDETGTDSKIAYSSDDDFSFETKVEAQNAKLTVNGVDIDSQSNTVEEAIQGVTLKLDATTDSAATLTVSKDTDSMNASVKAFVDAYNSVQKTADALTRYDASTDTAGLLLGNSTMRSIESRLRGALSTPTDDDGDYRLLSNLGIERQLDGSLKIDSDKLDKALTDNTDGVSQFFAGADGNSGFAGSFDKTLGTILDSGGSLQAATDGIDSTLESLKDRYSRMQDSISDTIDRYRKQFSRLDSMVSQMNSMSSYLNQQFSALSAQTK